MAQLQQKLLHEAERIGYELIGKAQKDDFGLFWETLSFDQDRKFIWRNSENIYAGDAGIILFLAELAKQSKDQIFRTTAEQALEALYYRCLSKPTDNYAFYTGRAGVAYLCCLLSDFLDDPQLLKRALELISDCEKFLTNPSRVDDFLNGTAGTLFVLTVLHSKTGEKSLERLIVVFTEELYKAAEIGNQGLFWDRSEKIIKGLCGMSHGAGGIGFVFQQMASYFNYGPFEKIAQEAFFYENDSFESEKGNWPDFRKSSYDEATEQEFESEYLDGNTGFFTKGGSMAAWCHGAPGIGLSRLYGKTDSNRKDIKRAADYTANLIRHSSGKGSYTLCHGELGNAMLLIEAQKILNISDYEKLLQQLAERAIQSHKDSGRYLSGYHSGDEVEDLSLFMGNAGIGYFYLAASGAPMLSSILSPAIQAESSKDPKELFKELPGIEEFLLKKMFPKTCERLLEVHNQKPGSFIHKKTAYHKINEAFHQFILKRPLVKDDQSLLDMYCLEKKSIEADRKIESYSLLSARNRFEFQHAQYYLKSENTAEWDNVKLSLVTDVLLVDTAKDCCFFENRSVLRKILQGEKHLIVPGARGTRTLPLNEFGEFLIDHLAQGISITELLNESYELFDCESDAEHAQVRGYLLEELMEAASLGIIQFHHSKSSRAEKVSGASKQLMQ